MLCKFVLSSQEKLSLVILLRTDSSSPSPSTAAPPVVPAPAPVPASESPAPADKPAKSKAELKAERRARQESERASKQNKKAEPGQQATAGKAKVQPSEPGAATSGPPALVPLNLNRVETFVFPFVFSREEDLRTCPGRQPGGPQETGKEAGKTTG